MEIESRKINALWAGPGKGRQEPPGGVLSVCVVVTWGTTSVKVQGAVNVSLRALCILFLNKNTSY